MGKERVSLDKFGQVALPDGAVRDGEVVDAEAVAKALRQLWSQVKFSSKKVTVGVANQKVIVRQVDLPWMPPAELKESLAFQVQDFIPIPVEHAVLDFHPLEELTSSAGVRVVRGLLVAASREMVMGLVGAVQKAGLTPEAVDLTSFAVLRSAVRGDALGTDVDALVDIGARVSNIVIHQGGVPRFVRILLLGGQDVTDAIADRMGIPVLEAEAIKQRMDLDLPSDEVDAVARRAVEGAASAFVDEVRGSLDYFMASSGSGPIGRLVLTGGGSRLGGLATRLSEATRLPVQPGRPISDLAHGKSALTDEQISFVEPQATVPVGLALGAVR